jgi:hypothetical protein
VDGGAAGLTYGDLTGVSLEREYNLSVLARTLLMGEINFRLPCDFNELHVVKITHISTSALYACWRPLYRIGRTDISKTPPTPIVFAFVLYITRDDRYISDRTGLVLQNPLKVHNADVASLHPPYAIAASSYPTFGDFAAMLLIAPQVRFQRRRYDPSLWSSIDGDAGPIREDPPSGYPLSARPYARGARHGA